MITYLIADASPLTLLLVKATVVTALALTAVMLLRRATAATRHALLALLFVFLLLLPAAALLAPPLRIEVPAAATQAVRAEADRVATATPSVVSRTQEAAPSNVAPTPRFDRSSVLLTIYLTGLLIVLLPMVAAVIRLQRIRRSGDLWIARYPQLAEIAAHAGVRRPIDLILSEQSTSPVTCGVLRPAILLPADAQDWEPGDLQRALIHEVEHIRRGDWGVQLLSRLVCAFYWFHPLAWVAARRLSLEAERSCDDAVLRVAPIADRYAEQLVVLARRMSVPGENAALAMARRSLLGSRIHSILDGRQPRDPLNVMRAAAGAAATLVLLLVVAPLQAVNGPASTMPAEVQGGAAPQSTLLEMAIIEAAAAGDLDVIDRLLSIGVSPDTSVAGDGSPLIVAARNGRRDAVEHLLAKGASVNHAVPGDGNPLIMAAARGHVDIVRLLLDRGADVERIVPGDENALITASSRGHADVVRLLIARGADVTTRVVARTATGEEEIRTALRLARRAGHDEVERLLLSAGATD
ncbi:MAG TPA: M56 family metallopeptidase [Thermoanaerobaculia bacterium]